MTIAPASGAPAIIASRPSPMVSSIGRSPARVSSPERIGWPPAICPASWAMTPLSSLGVAASRMRPVFSPIC